MTRSISGGFEEETASFESGDPFECSPEHDVFLCREVENTLAKKQRGEIRYTSLDDAMTAFLH